MRPRFQVLGPDLVSRIIDEARVILDSLGVEIHNEEVTRLLGENGGRVDAKAGRVRIGPDLVDRALKTVPRSFKLYDTLGNETHNFHGDAVHFTPGSAALYILDDETGETRRPVTADYVRYAKLVSRLPHIAAQSTAMIPADVPERISDSYRLYLSLRFCEKPVVTGTFTAGAFGVMRDLQVAVRGGADDLRAKPLTIFSCCPTAPLKWSFETSQNVVDCARNGIPVEYISMPLSGFMAPVTLVGSLVQHTAETLSGIVISQLAAPGTPALYGGSPAIFDVRYETTPMGAIETMMIDCASSEIGKTLGLPTQAYISLSDAKLLDAQAGLESAMGATLAALSGINNISGPGMLDFESCQCLEKLVLDNEICGMALRLVQGVEEREDFPALPRFEELLKEQHLLISTHTRRYLRREHYFPGPVIDRAQRSRWQEEGGLTLGQRARREIARHFRDYVPPRVAPETLAEMERLMTAEARQFGMETLPPLQS